jgi:hypothetical protein
MEGKVNQRADLFKKQIETQSKMDVHLLAVTNYQKYIKLYRIQYEDLSKSKDENKINLKEFKRQLDSSKEIMVILNEFKASILDNNSISSEKEKEIVGQCIIASCTAAFLGNESKLFKQYAQAGWNKELAMRGLISTRDFDFISMVFTKSFNELCYSQSLPIDSEIFEKILIAKHQFSIPLMFDSRLLSERYIRALENTARKLLVYNASDEDIQEKLLIAKQKGWKVILYIHRSMPLCIELILPDLIIPMQPELFRTPKIEDDFKLYLITPCNKKYFRKQRWMQWTTPISIDPLGQYAENLLSLGICESVDQKLFKTYTKNRLEYYTKIYLLSQLHRKCCQLINSMNELSLLGGDVTIH